MSAASAPPGKSSFDASSLAHQLFHEQIRLLCIRSREAMIGGVLCAVFVGFVLMEDHSAYAIGVWLASQLAITAVRGAYQQRLLDGRTPIDARSYRLVLLGAFVHGLSWAAPGTLLMPVTPDRQVVLALFIVGLAATTVTSLSPVRFAYSNFVGGMLVPLALYYFYLGEQYATSAIGIVAFILFMALGAQRQTVGIAELLKLQLENSALAQNLKREKDEVEQANRDLHFEITQRERTEAALRTSMSEAQAANRAKSQFLANMSHELRTPLNGILGMSELLLRSLPSPGQLVKHLKYTQTIHGAGQRLLHLINDILDMARIEAGALRLEHQSFAPRELVAEVVDLTVKQCNDKGLKLSVNVSPQVPSLLRGDADRLRQVLLNLVVNAIKFTERGGVEVRVERAAGATVEGDQDHVALRWSVTDSGIGIADDARNQLFQPFSQVDDSATRKYGGSGLGLAICQQLVQAMGGRIDVQTVQAQGSTFWFELAFEIPSSVSAQLQEPAAHPVTRGGRILVVEDNATNAQLIMEMLNLSDCQASIALNGREALELMKTRPFDVVLMDWHMPEMDGVAAAKAWREFEEAQQDGRRLPIIALTASVLPGDREACINAGMDDFVGKPFTYDELISTIARWLPQSLQTSEV